MEYTNETDDKYDDGADVLDDHCRVCNEGPEVIRLQTRVSLELFQKGILIGVIIWVCNHLAVRCVCS